jgi:hypothetical protein
MEPVLDKIIVVKAWELNRHLTGVPSHFKELVNLQALKVEQSKLAENIFTKLMGGGLADYFDTWQIGSGEMTEARIKELIALVCKQNVDELVKRVETTVDNLKTVFKESSFGNGGTPVRQDAEDAVQHHATFMLPANSGGEISRLPSDFQFPKAGIYDCWVQWNIGNSEEQIPPLQKLGPREFLFILYVIILESKAGDAGVDTSDLSLGNVWKMYDAAVKDLIIPGKQKQRVDQLKW